MYWPATFHKEPLEAIFDPSDLIYLSPDGQSTLESIDPTKIYVIGGFVDRSVNKNQSAMRASELNCPSMRLPIKEYYPDCTHPVMNVNTMVEILTHFMDFGDWRTSFEKFIPQRKVHNREQEREEYDFSKIKTEDQLLALSTMKLTKFEFRKALERFCIKKKWNLTFEKLENDIKKEGCTGKSRYEVKAFINGNLVGEGNGSNMRIATAYASWRGLKQCGAIEN